MENQKGVRERTVSVEREEGQSVMDHVHVNTTQCVTEISCSLPVGQMKQT